MKLGLFTVATDEMIPSPQLARPRNEAAGSFSVRATSTRYQRC